MAECPGCGLKSGHKVYGSMVCEYASERSALYDSETKELTTWPGEEEAEDD